MENNKPILWLDFDTTLVDSTRSMIDTYKYLTGEEPKTYEDLTWNLKTAYPNYNKDVIHKIFDTQYFFDVLQLFEGVYESLELLSEYYTLKICSYGTPINLMLKKQWIIKNLPMIEENNIVLLEQNKKDFDKSVCVGDVLIDDRLEPLLTCNCTYKILFRYNDKNYEWQEGHEDLLLKGDIDFCYCTWEHLMLAYKLINLI